MGDESCTVTLETEQLIGRRTSVIQSPTRLLLTTLATPTGYGVVNQSDGVGLGHTNFAAKPASEISPLQGSNGSVEEQHDGCCARFCHCLSTIPLPSLIVYLLFWAAFGVAVDGGRKFEDGLSGIPFGVVEPMLALTHGLCGTMMTLSLLFIVMTAGTWGDSLVAMEAGAEDDGQEWNCCVRTCFKCFFSCFWLVEHGVIVLLYGSIVIAVVTSMLLGVITAVSAIVNAACGVSSSAVVSLCPGLYLMQQSKHEFRTMGLVEYFCQCKTTVDATSGACQAEGWQVTANFQDTCGSVDTLTTGAAMMMIGEVVAASLVVIMFDPFSLGIWCAETGNLVKSSERISTLMQAARDRASSTSYSIGRMDSSNL